MKDRLRELIGFLPKEHGFKRKMRLHQGWWRAFVLAEEQGNHPVKKGETVCNTIRGGEVNRKNFLSQHIVDAVMETIKERRYESSGMIEENRLYNNLLSSQPLCFNFFGELKMDTDFALQVLKQFNPGFTEVRQVIFEYAPSENYTNDNSAFDVAIEVLDNNKTGLLGLECKYTDSFSSREYNKDAYRRIFDCSDAFERLYAEYIVSRYNQLFRNQLIAEALVQNGKYDFVVTGLFCHHEDRKALEIGAEFQHMLTNGEHRFRIITYQNFIEAVQRSDIRWEHRELSMLLWARYCGRQLSEQLF